MIKELYQGQKPLSRRYYLLRYFIGKISYNLLWPFSKTLFKIFLRFEVRNPQKLKNLKGPLIIAANHTSFVDPFLIGAAFPFNSRVYPIWFATAPKYYYFPLFLPFVWCLASFPIFKKIGLENSLRVPVKILEEKGVVGIFPEGKVWHRGRPRKGRRGTAYLALKTKTPILPIKVEGALNLNLKNFILRKKHVRIIVGDIINPSSRRFPKDINKATDFITEKIRGLQ